MYIKNIFTSKYLQSIYYETKLWKIFNDFLLTIVLQNPSVTCSHFSQVHQGFKNEPKCSARSSGRNFTFPENPETEITSALKLKQIKSVRYLHCLQLCDVQGQATSNPGHVNTWMSDPHVVEHSEFMSDLFPCFTCIFSHEFRPKGVYQDSFEGA